MIMDTAGHSVILLHGLARTRGSMARLGRILSSHGYQVVNQGYPSRSAPVEQLVKQALPAALAQCENAARISFVTHSMGAILLRSYLRDQPLPRLHRVVMLGPPNQGSEVVDKLGAWPGFKLINGPAGLQLGTGSGALPAALGPADFRPGIIAGTRTINLLLSLLIPGPNDGKVSVARTRLEGMGDHLQLPVSHSFMMQNPVVAEQVLYFLEHGRFRHLPTD